MSRVDARREGLHEVRVKRGRRFPSRQEIKDQIRERMQESDGGR